MTQYCNFLRECGVFWVLTSEERRPCGRPFGAVTEIDGALYIATNAKKRVFRQMLSNSAVQLTAIKNGTREWIRIDGNASVCTEREKKVRMLADCPNLLKHYASADDEKFTLIRVDVSDVEQF